MEKLTKALMTDETGQAIVGKLNALSRQMHELAMATRGSAILFESESDISVLGDGGYLAVYVGSTNPLVVSGWTGDNSLVTGHLYYLVKSGTAVASSDLGEYGGTADTDTTLSISDAPADAKAVGDALAEKADTDDVGDLSQLTTTAKDNLVSAINAAVEADAKVVGNLKSAIDDINGLTEIQYTRGFYISSNVNVGSEVILTPTPSSTWRYAIVNCNENDLFTISGVGSSPQLLWAFIDSSNNLIKKSSSNLTGNEIILKAPYASSKLIINDKNSEKLSYIGVIPEKNFAEAADVKALQAENDYSIGLTAINFTDGAYIETYVRTIGDPVNNHNWRFSEVGSSEGDTYIINAKGSSPQTAWAFIGANNTVLRNGGRNATLVNEIIIAPSGTLKLVINDNNTGKYCFKVSDAIIWQLKDWIDQTGYNNIIPTYYRGYISSKSKEINKMNNNSYLSGDTFIFVTDYHRQSNTKHSAALIQYLMDNTGTRTVVFGGDTQNYEDTFDKGMAETVGFFNDYRSLSGNMKNVIGNHEYNSHYYNQDPASYPNVRLTKSQIWNLLCRRNEADYIDKSDNGDYYFDNKLRKIRYFVVASDAACHIPTDSIHWLLEKFREVPAGYHIVVLSHLSYETSTTYVGKIFTDNYVRHVALGLDALNDRTTYTYDGVEYDYSASHAIAEIIIGGHTHFDADPALTIMIGVVPVIPVVATTTDAYGKQKTDVEELALTRTAGTTTEQAFDVIHLDLDNRVAYYFRVGAGANRVINIKPVTVSGTLTLTPKASSSHTFVWTTSNSSVATVSDGVVTGVSSGVARIAAVDEYDGTREIWIVKVS